MKKKSSEQNVDINKDKKGNKETKLPKEDLSKESGGTTKF